MNNPNVVFRVDSSLQIGIGHVMRCLTLADALCERGAKSTFICRPHDGHLLDLIRQRGHTVKALVPADDAFNAPANPTHANWLGTDWASDAVQTQHALGDQVVDWLVVDHYALDSRWEQVLRSHSRRIMVIDDLADRPHDCDLLLDQNLGRQAQDYGGLLSRHTHTVIGPAYALLRPEFAQWRERSLQRRTQPTLKNLLITMGGVDQANATGQVLEALSRCELPTDLRITVVMGPTAPWLAQVQGLAVAMPRPTQVLAGVSNMAQLMAENDLCIGAAGSTNWERCCLGLPCLLLVLADNQQTSADALAEANAVRVLALSSLPVSLPAHMLNLASGSTLKVLGNAAQAITSGQGAQQLVRQMLPTIHSQGDKNQFMAGESI